MRGDDEFDPRNLIPSGELNDDQVDAQPFVYSGWLGEPRVTELGPRWLAALLLVRHLWRELSGTHWRRELSDRWYTARQRAHRRLLDRSRRPRWSIDLEGDGDIATRLPRRWPVRNRLDCRHDRVRALNSRFVVLSFLVCRHCGDRLDWPNMGVGLTLRTRNWQSRLQTKLRRRRR